MYNIHLRIVYNNITTNKYQISSIMNIWSCICISLTCIPFNSNIVGEKEHLIINENKNIELQINSGHAIT